MNRKTRAVPVAKKTILGMGIVLFFYFVLVPPPEGLGDTGARALGVFSICVALWVTNYLPLAITSLLGMVLIPLLGVMDAGEAFAFFGDRAVFFILGALMIAAAIYHTGLGARIAYLLLARFDKKPANVVLGIMLSAALLSCIMPEHAVVAMLFPIVLELAGSMKLKPLQSKFGISLFLALAWGAIIGGVTTYLGGARNLLAVSLLERNYGLTIDFFEWIKYAIPIPLVLLVIAYFLLAIFFKPEVDSAEGAYHELTKRIRDKGPLSKEELKLITVLVLVIFTWLLFSKQIHISVTALMGGVAVFIIKVIDWKDMVSYINWGVILMYGGAIVVASAITSTGATSWMAGIIFSQMGYAPLVYIALIIAMTLILTEGISNVAAVAIMIPLAFGVGEVLNINPVAITLFVALSGGLAFCLPMGTPPNAIAFSSGYYRISDSVKVGLILNIVSIIVVLLVAIYYWPLVGLSILI